tara:strand:+ start:834 stop:1091 length:258 start_codon:yes stop_codon:yes gene_type:complete
MKKKFINTFVGRIVTGAVGAVPYVGKDIQNELKSNTKAPTGGEGHLDYARLIGYSMVMLIFMLKLLDVITWEELDRYMKLLLKLG